MCDDMHLHLNVFEMVIYKLSSKIICSNKPIQNASQIQTWGQSWEEGTPFKKGSSWDRSKDCRVQEAYCCEVWAEPCDLPYWAGLDLVRNVSLFCFVFVSLWSILWFWFTFFFSEQGTVGCYCTWCGPNRASGLASSVVQEDGDPLLHCEGKGTLGNGGLALTFLL